MRKRTKKKKRKEKKRNGIYIYIKLYRSCNAVSQRIVNAIVNTVHPRTEFDNETIKLCAKSIRHFFVEPSFFLPSFLYARKGFLSRRWSTRRSTSTTCQPRSNRKDYGKFLGQFNFDALCFLFFPRRFDRYSLS